MNDNEKGLEGNVDCGQSEAQSGIKVGRVNKWKERATSTKSKEATE